MASDRPSPDAEQVAQAAAALPSLERAVLVLAAGERLPNDRIAERLGISEPRVRRLLARALRRLDRTLEEDERR